MAVAIDARPVAQRLVERLAQRDARCPRRCGARRSPGRRSTLTSRSSRPWRATRSSMWSRKPTPVVRWPSPVPSSVRRSWTSVSLVVRLISAERLTAPHSSRRAPPSTARARSNPSARAIGAPARASSRGRLADVHLGHPPAERARRQRRGEAGRAAGRQRVVRAGRRSRRTPSPLAAPTNTQPAAAHAPASASASAPTSCEVLGREGLGDGQPVLEVGHLDHAAAALAPRRPAGAGQRVEQAGVVGDRGHDRALAVLGLGEQVERHELRVGVTGGQHQQVAGPEEAVDPDVARDQPLGLLDVEGARAGDHVDRVRSSRCRRPARRPRARRPSR